MRALKPVASGFDAANGPTAATRRCCCARRASTLDCANFDAVSPWRFAAPLSPDMAAARERRSIPFDALSTFCRAAARRSDVTLIEGIGGVMVPLDAEHTVLDWIAARRRAGATRRRQLSRHAEPQPDGGGGAAVSAACTIAGIVVSESEEQPVPAAETAATLARFVGSIPLRVLRARAAGTAPLLPLLEPYFA